MAVFDTYIPDAFVSRTVDPINDWLVKMENHGIVQKYLTYYGVGTVSALTNAQKGAVFSGFHIWSETRKAEVDEAIDNARGPAEASALGDFNP